MGLMDYLFNVDSMRCFVVGGIETNYRRSGEIGADNRAALTCPVAKNTGLRSRILSLSVPDYRGR